MLARRTESSRAPLAVALSALTLVALATAPARAGALPTADELIDRSMKAMGGKAVEKIESYMAAAEITAPMGTMTSEVSWAKPNRVFAKQVMPQAGETLMGTDGEIAWVHNAMMGGYSLLEGKQRDQVIEQAMHIRLMHLRETAKDQLEFKSVTEADFDGVKCFELAFVGTEENQEEEGSVFFDADSGLIRGMRVMDNDQPATILLRDWKPVDGVRFFHKMEMASGPMAFSINYTKIEVNQVDPSVFAVPAEVKELAKTQAGKSGDEIKLEDLSPQAQSMVKGMMEGLPWDNLGALEQARDSIARQADTVPGDFGKGMKYVLAKIDAALAGGG